MFNYHDMNYVNYILNLPYKEGLFLYNKCIGRFNDIRTWDLYLIDIQAGYEGNYIQYKKDNDIKNNIKDGKKMSNEDGKKEFDRILKNNKKIIKMFNRGKRE